MFSLIVPAAIRGIVDQMFHCAYKTCFCVPDIVEPRNLWHYHLTFSIKVIELHMKIKVTWKLALFELDTQSCGIGNGVITFHF